MSSQNTRNGVSQHKNFQGKEPLAAQLFGARVIPQSLKNIPILHIEKGWTVCRQESGYNYIILLQPCKDEKKSANAVRKRYLYRCLVHKQIAQVIISNYWMRLRRIWSIMQIEWVLSASANTLRDLHNYFLYIRKLNPSQHVYLELCNVPDFMICLFLGSLRLWAGGMFILAYIFQISSFHSFSGIFAMILAGSSDISSSQYSWNLLPFSPALPKHGTTKVSVVSFPFHICTIDVNFTDIGKRWLVRKHLLGDLSQWGTKKYIK